MTHDFILDGFQFNELGETVRIKPENYSSSINSWIHCNRASPNFEKWLNDENIDESIIDSLLATDTRPRFQLIDGDSFFLILRGVNLNQGKNPDDMLTIRILYSPTRVITCSLQHSTAIASVITEIDKAKGPENLELLVISILNYINVKIETVLDPIENFIDSLDSDVFTKDEMADVSSMHKRLLKLNRFLKPQIHALSAMNKNLNKSFESHNVNLANQLDTLQRIVDTIDFYIAQIDVFNSRISQFNSEVINRNTYLLSIISGIFLPLGFLTGLFGINIGGMPGVDNSQAFYWFCGILTGIGVFEIALFKRLNFL